jgi:hypothetical protein
MRLLLSCCTTKAAWRICSLRSMIGLVGASTLSWMLVASSFSMSACKLNLAADKHFRREQQPRSCSMRCAVAYSHSPGAAQNVDVEPQCLLWAWVLLCLIPVARHASYWQAREHDFFALNPCAAAATSASLKALSASPMTQLPPNTTRTVPAHRLGMRRSSALP